MKTIKSIFTILILSVAFTTISCDVEPIDPALNSIDEDGGDDGGDTGSDCYSPLSISVVRNNIDNSKANLNWSVGGNEVNWEIQYGHSGFILGNGNIISSSTQNIVINDLDNQGYDFYIRSVCSTTESSDWEGPFVINPISVSPPSYMNATVNGESFTGMKPYFYPISGLKATLSYGYDDPEKKIIKIQGDTNPLAAPPNNNNFIQINLSIPDDFWNLNVNSLSDGDFETECVVNLIIVRGSNTWEILESELPGTIQLTEFNPTTKRIKGVFSFQYELHENGAVIGGPYNVVGDFDFEGEDEIFD